MARAIESEKSSQTSAISENSSETASPLAGKSPHLQLVDGPIAPDARIGDRMRAARLHKGLEIEDVARQLRLRRDYIEAMEAMQVTRLPKGFVNPYIRDYARVIGLDPVQAVEAFNQQCGAITQSIPEPVSVPQSGTRDPSNILRIIVVLVGLIIAAALGWFGYKFVTTPVSEPVVESTPALPVGTAFTNGARAPVTATPTISPANRPLNLEIRADRRAWIEIRGADGTLFVDRHFSRGESYDLRVGAGWTLTTQDAGAFSWMVDGEAFMPVGDADQPLYTLGVDSIATAIREMIETNAH